MNCVIKPLDVLILIYDIIINMRKKRLIFYCIILMFFCQCSTGAMAITEAQSEAIVEHCATIKDDLKKLGYVRYYYEKVVGSETLFAELYFVPKIQLDTFEQTLYPNGILHLRFIRPTE